jgi:hypothetical protein
VICETVVVDPDLDLGIARRAWRASKQTTKRNVKASAIKDSVLDLCALRLEFTMDLWSALKNIFQKEDLEGASKLMLTILIDNSDVFLDFPFNESGVRQTSTNASRDAWTRLVVDVLSTSRPEVTRSFWGLTKIQDMVKVHWSGAERRHMWQYFAKHWVESAAASEWETAIALLAVPFTYVTVFVSEGISNQPPGLATPLSSSPTT